MKMEAIEGSETSAFKTQKPGKYPKENILHKEHGESLKSRNIARVLDIRYVCNIAFDMEPKILAFDDFDRITEPGMGPRD